MKYRNIRIGLSLGFVAGAALVGSACGRGSDVSDFATPVHQTSIATSQALTWNPPADSLVATAQAKLVTMDGKSGDQVGWSVAISGDTAVVGAYGDDDKGDAAGAAYVFVRSGGSWMAQQQLYPNDAAAFNFIGSDVAISGDTVLLGASQNNAVAPTSGAAYVFVRNGGVWTQQQKLVPMDALAQDEFGVAIALEGDTAVVTTTANDLGPESGSAYVFVRNGTTWTEQAKLLPNDGAANDYFGTSVALSGNTVIIGSWQDDDKGSSSGSAYVFVRNGAVWTQQAKLLASDGAAGDWFGWSVSLSGDTAVIAAPEHDAKGMDAGAAYVFVRNAGTWTQQAKLLAATGAPGDRFGKMVGVSGDVAIAGASYTVMNGGSAYMFTRSGTTWTEEQIIKPPDPESTNFFGQALCIEGTSVIVGAPGATGVVPSTGAAYAFTLGPNAGSGGSGGAGGTGGAGTGGSGGSAGVGGMATGGSGGTAGAGGMATGGSGGGTAGNGGTGGSAGSGGGAGEGGSGGGAQPRDDASCDCHLPGQTSDPVTGGSLVGLVFLAAANRRRHRGSRTA